MIGSRFTVGGRTGSSPRRTRRQVWLTAIAALALPIGVMSAPFAQAGTTPPFTIGPNGSAVVPGADGAINLPDPFGSGPEGKELGPLNSNTTKIGVIHKDAVPTLGLTNPNGQVDLRQAWLKTAKDGDNDDWIYFAWERDNNTGSGFIAYEFMKNAAPAACVFGAGQNDDALIASCNPWANRTTGDFLILWDQQGGSLALTYRQWTGTAPNLTLSAPVAIPAAFGVAALSADGFRGEAAINITDTIFGGVQQCLVFSNVIPSTVTGNSDTADYKDTILRSGITLGGCTSTTVTTPKTGAGASIPGGGISITTAGVVEVKDSATISLTGGAGAPGGSVQFALCKAGNVANATCDSAATNIGAAVPVTDADNAFPVTLSSPSAWVTSAGRYCWKATYSGVPASGIAGSSDNSIGECFVVNPVTATLSTTAGSGGVLGSAITDSATLGGTAPQPTAAVIHAAAPDPATRTAAGGTITFKLYGPSDVGCGPLVHTSAAVNVSGNAAYGTPVPQYVPTEAGDYHWVAVYSGNLPNTVGLTHNSACDDTNEDVTVTTVTPTLATAQSWVPNDSATITASAGGDLTGNVSFTLYRSADCTGTVVYGPASVPIPAGAGLSETVSTSNSTAVTTGGDFSWSVSYDSTNPAQVDLAASCHEVSNLTINNSAP